MCLFAIILQQPVETLMSKLKGKQKHLVLNLFHLLSSFGSVATWRGIWTIFPRYIFHEDPVHSNIIMASVGFGGLTLLNVSQSSINKGIYRDGDGNAGEPVELSYKYFKDLIFQEKESSKSPSTLDTPCTEVEFIYEVKQRLSVV
ncbi:uncharacterized protein LOC136030412 [Artemia franciscana]|uniref:uncharacterized protein LOC136030412 n=1 Tax=Artemia franciscana TaxID=6661 RepID=UPI0032D9FB83